MADASPAVAARPTSVVVLGQAFSIEYVTPDRVSLARDGHSAGRTAMAHLRMLVNADQHEMQIRDTVMHEVAHACLHIQELSAEDEEFVGRLAPVLLDVLRSNPHLVAWLTAGI
ncbi:MAG: hypothetical protein QOJ81_2191 [Chloroflexota bacterium]|nr:hypothetical protein [Chloroflexota bacterium]